MRHPVQLTLNLKTEQSYLPEDFIVSACNQEAHNYVTNWPNWHAHCCILYGPTGSGKTHLANVWKYYTNARTFKVSDLVGINLHDFLKEHNAVIIEYDAREETMFHLYNAAKEHGTYILILLKQNVASMGIALPDLKSRLMSCPQFKLDLPDDQMVHMLIMKHFVDCNMPIDEKQIEYIAKRVARSYQEIEDFVYGLCSYLRTSKAKCSSVKIKEYLQTLHAE